MGTELIAILLVQRGSADDQALRAAEREEPRWFRLLQADRLERALAAIEEYRIDIILLDPDLPDGVGMGPIRKLREQAPRTPIIFIGAPEMAASAMDAGAQAALARGDLFGPKFRRAVRLALERKAGVSEPDSETLKAQLEEARLATLDPITGLHHRTYLRQSLMYEMIRADRYRPALSLAMIALEGIGGIREREGDEAAERALRSAAETIRKGVRDTDIAARYDDAEFCVVLTETPASGAEVFARRILQRLGHGVGGPLAESGGATLDLAPAVGIAEYHGSILDTVGFIKRARRALERARELGPGFICTFTPEGKISTAAANQPPQ